VHNLIIILYYCVYGLPIPFNLALKWKTLVSLFGLLLLGFFVSPRICSLVLRLSLTYSHDGNAADTFSRASITSSHKILAIQASVGPSFMLSSFSIILAVCHLTEVFSVACGISRIRILMKSFQYFK
jgi:hypothetical protein